MTHLLSGFFKLLRSARLPNSSAKAPSIIDFPAPVSPVIIDKSSSNVRVTSSISAKFLIDSEFSKSFYFLQGLKIRENFLPATKNMGYVKRVGFPVSHYDGCDAFMVSLRAQ